ncbi:MAG: SCP2 sterol-binding domain-containing protein [Pseudomonadota bacterium]
MSQNLESAAEKLRGKLDGKDFSGSVKFDIDGEGSIVADGTGVRVGEEEAEVTVSGDLDTFRDLFDGELDPTSAFMTGKIRIDGDMGAAMKLVQYL